MTLPLLEFWVPGFPRPKGSLKLSSPVGSTKVRVQEQVDPEGVWRKRVLTYARRAAVQQSAKTPLDFPVAISILFLFTPPSSPMFNFPATTTVGDLDKLTRNVFDALAPTKLHLSQRILKDDSRVVNLHTNKAWAAPTESEGAFVQLFPAVHPSRTALIAYRQRLITLHNSQPFTPEQELFS